jgi:hypothetical protein
MNYACRAMMAVAICAGTFAAESSASASISLFEWVNLGLPPDNSHPTLVAATPYPSVVVSTNTGIWSYDGDSWQHLSTYNGAISLVADASGVPYILDANGHPLVWNGVSNVTGLPRGFNWAVPKANNQPGSGGSAICPRPKELALGAGNQIWVIPCGTQNGTQIIYGDTINSNFNWGTSYYVRTNNGHLLQSIGGNTQYTDPWTVDNGGLTYLASKPYAQEWSTPYIQYTVVGAQVIGNWGPSAYGMAIAEGSRNSNGDYPVADYTNGSWSWPYYGGYAHALSVESYTTAALVTTAQDVWVITFD